MHQARGRTPYSIFHAVRLGTGAARTFLTLQWTDTNPDAHTIRIVDAIPDDSLEPAIPDRLRALRALSDTPSPTVRVSQALPGAPPRRTPPPSLRWISDFLGIMLIIRSWNVASLFGSDARDPTALRRHRSKLRLLARLVDNTHAVALKETHGMDADLTQLHGVLPQVGVLRHLRGAGDFRRHPHHDLAYRRLLSSASTLSSLLAQVFSGFVAALRRLSTFVQLAPSPRRRPRDASSFASLLTPLLRFTRLSLSASVTSIVVRPGRAGWTRRAAPST